jgi:hypothetical protein
MTKRKLHRPTWARGATSTAQAWTEGFKAGLAQAKLDARKPKRKAQS